MIVMTIAVTPSLKATIRATVPDLEPLSAVLRDAIVANPLVSEAFFYHRKSAQSVQRGGDSFYLSGL
jgi:hypothetical protein